MRTDLRVLAETTRKLQDLTWASGQLVTRDLPRDTVLKRVNIRMSGTAVYTFGSTPVAPEVGTMDAIVPRIDIIVNGSKTVKSVRPHLLHMEQIMRFGIQGERKASAAAAAAYNTNPVADGGFLYGTSTQTTTVAETVTINFEMILARTDKESTWLNLKGVSSAELKLTCGTVAGLDKSTNATFTSSAFTFTVTTVEAQDVPPTQVFADWRQTFKNVTYSSQQTEAAIDLPRGNFLAGIKLFVVMDAGNADGTATNRSKPNINSVSNLKLRVNGNRVVKATTFQSLVAEMRNRWGVNAAYASSVSRIDGFAYLDLLNAGILATALDVRQPMVDSVELLIDTLAADATNNIYNVGITVETGEIVKYAA